MDINANLSSGVRMESAECPTALLESLSNSEHDPQKSDAPVRKSHINKAPICLKSKYQRMCRHKKSFDVESIGHSPRIHSSSLGINQHQSISSSNQNVQDEHKVNAHYEHSRETGNVEPRVNFRNSFNSNKRGSSVVRNISAKIS